jgi:hypothetical protein
VEDLFEGVGPDISRRSFKPSRFCEQFTRLTHSLYSAVPKRPSIAVPSVRHPFRSSCGSWIQFLVPSTLPLSFIHSYISIQPNISPENARWRFWRRLGMRSPTRDFLAQSAYHLSSQQKRDVYWTVAHMNFGSSSLTHVFCCPSKWAIRTRMSLNQYKNLIT